jgi:hypothetical protein
VLIERPIKISFGSKERTRDLVTSSPFLKECPEKVTFKTNDKRRNFGTMRRKEKYESVQYALLLLLSFLLMEAKAISRLIWF